MNLFKPNDYVEMQPQVTLWREHNMGDHAERLPEAIKVFPNETIQDIANRVLNRTGTYYQTNFSDSLVIQLVNPEEDGRA